MTAPIETDLAGLAARIEAAQGARRRIVAVAGPPGSGKSTFAERLVERMSAWVPSAVLPMDGYHYDDIVLNARGHRPRKGAPHTFDVDGLAATLARLAADDGREVAVPVFDRSIEIARAGARIIGPEVRLVVVEGNYLLLDDPAWAPLRAHFDATVLLAVPMSVIEARLGARWAGYGFEGEAFRAKMEENDLPNARLVAGHSVAPTYLVPNDG
ncbi:MAG: nucleoside/nucleotide kinase family protein [Amaricoccus sp.]